MTDANAQKFANRYGRTAGEWCRIYYTATMLIDWRDLYNYAKVVKNG